MFGEPTINYTFVNINAAGQFAIIAKSPDEEKFGVKPNKREYISKKMKIKVKKEIYEFTTNSLKGTLLRAKIRNTDFGDQISFVLKVNDKDKVYHFMINANTNSIYGRKLLEIFPNLYPNDKILIKVWDTFNGNSGLVHAGLNILNVDTENHVKSFFWDFENKKPLHGLPRLEKNSSPDDRKIFFLQSEKILKEYFKNNVQSRFIDESDTDYDEYSNDNNDPDNSDILDELRNDSDIVKDDDDDLPF